MSPSFLKSVFYPFIAVCALAGLTPAFADQTEHVCGKLVYANYQSLFKSGYYLVSPQSPQSAKQKYFIDTITKNGENNNEWDKNRLRDSLLAFAEGTTGCFEGEVGPDRAGLLPRGTLVLRHLRSASPSR
jgi:hypothetical protein